MIFLFLGSHEAKILAVRQEKMMIACLCEALLLKGNVQLK